MAIIFENKRIEKNDTVGPMRFPTPRNLTNLPFGCNNNGQFGSLSVTDEGGTPWTLTIRNRNGLVYFTDGWDAFRVGKGITVGHTISLYKDDEADLYRIKVVKPRS